MLLLSLPGFVRVGVRVLLEAVAVRDGAAGVPALAGALLHAAAALLDQVAHVPLGDVLLDAAGEDRGGVGGHRLVGGEEADVALLELALYLGGIGGHPREAVDRLDDHRVEDPPVGGGVQQVGEPAFTRHRYAEPGAIWCPAIGESLAARLDVPVVGYDVSTCGLDGTLAGGELAGDRE